MKLIFSHRRPHTRRVNWHKNYQNDLHMLRVIIRLTMAMSGSVFGEISITLCHISLNENIFFVIFLESLIR